MGIIMPLVTRLGKFGHSCPPREEYSLILIDGVIVQCRISSKMLRDAITG